MFTQHVPVSVSTMGQMPMRKMMMTTMSMFTSNGENSQDSYLMEEAKAPLNSEKTLNLTMNIFMLDKEQQDGTMVDAVFFIDYN
ncbi:hypothetical protein TNCV_3799961 [Trichonephila clavipes]|nr:hypothetical protein TNCV_3799961 [Trichonephila clavipes]